MVSVSLSQVTALGNPKLLERVSNGVLAIQSLFQQFDTDGNNQVTRDEFAQVGLPAFHCSSRQCWHLPCLLHSAMHCNRMD